MSLTEVTRIETRLYGSTAGEVLAVLAAVDHRVESVLVVAHNPGLQDLALELAGEDAEIVSRLSQSFPTGALAEVVSACRVWSDLGDQTTRVASLTVPRDLPD